MIPELRTSRPFAIALVAGAVVAIGISVLGVEKLEEALDSASGARLVLGAWCLLGAAAAITAIVDAYIQPEGERLELATRVGATLFGLLALVVVIGIVVGATGALESDDDLDDVAVTSAASDFS